MRPYEPGLRDEQIVDIAKTDKIHKLSSNESAFGPFDSAILAMRGELENLQLYPDGSCHLLRQKLVEHFSEYNIKPEQLMIGNGTNELLMLMGKLSLKVDDEVLYCWPSFIVYRMLTQIAKAKAVEVPLTSEGAFDLCAMKERVNEKTKLIFICTPNNPTGGIISREELSQFLEDLPKSVMVVLDEAYVHYIDSDKHFNSLEFFDGKRPFVVLRTFSKIFGLAGARVGFGIAPAPYIEGFDKLREPFNVNSVAQAAARACIDDSDEIERRRQVCKEGREQLYACFDELGIKYYPSEANFVWVMHDGADHIYEELMKEGVIVRSFGAADAIRITIGSHDDTIATIEALKKVLA
jgi:histidinol-phosphate aminotransferase